MESNWTDSVNEPVGEGRIATLEITTQTDVAVSSRPEELPPPISLQPINKLNQETPILLGLRDVNAELSPPSYVEATQPIIPEGYAGLPSTSDSSQHPNDATTTLERMSKIAGYHSIGLKPVPIIPPVMNDTENVEESRIFYANEEDEAIITEDKAREILLGEAAQHFCWGLNTAKKMKILDIFHGSAFQLVLETFTERREAAWCFEPYQGQNIDPPSNGDAPDAWDISAMPSQMFKDSSFVIEVPHTADIQPCHECSALGRKRCWSCIGSGQIRCVACNGTGDIQSRLTTTSSTSEGGVNTSYQQTTQVPGRCLVCAGMGRRRCASCLGQGHLPCSTCLARGRLKFSIKITITWRVHKEEAVIDKGDIPPSILYTARGKLLMDEEKSRVGPLERFSDQRVVDASRHIVDKHSNMFPYERILLQRLSLRVLPVNSVTYEWRKHIKQFYIYGAEQRVYCPDYPQQECCGLFSYFR
ncbi:protein SSUH2 homolog [Artemia franciscana]|uniref:Protein SSUH2 homolog n=1 Tax=Artemia franciscana TaxID=6661 RepID=A0AA88LDG9_ARTSF|nr:hypothetical protein QYM36_002739 [Artemia franciscana]